jgi:hypothetical protein
VYYATRVLDSFCLQKIVRQAWAGRRAAAAGNAGKERKKEKQRETLPSSRRKRWQRLSRGQRSQPHSVHAAPMARPPSRLVAQAATHAAGSTLRAEKQVVGLYSSSPSLPEADVFTRSRTVLVHVSMTRYATMLDVLQVKLVWPISESFACACEATNYCLVESLSEPGPTPTLRLVCVAEQIAQLGKHSS